MPIVGLVAGVEPLRYPPDWLERRPWEDKLHNGLEKVQLRDSLALFGLFMGGSDDLRAFAGPGPFNTDDRPVGCCLRAPHFVYAPQETTRRQAAHRFAAAAS